MNRTKRKSPRVWEIDFFRGVPLIGLLLYHLAFDITLIPNICSNYFQVARQQPAFNSFVMWVNDTLFSPAIDNLVPVFAGTFLLIVGVSCSFSHSNFIRGLKIYGIAIALTIITVIASNIIDEDFIIVNGILHCIGLTLIIYGSIELLMKKLKKEITPYLPFMIGLTFIFATLIVNNSYPPSTQTFKAENIFYIIIGRVSTFADWFPLFPWSGVILCGISIGKLWYSKRVSLLPRLDGRWNKPICFMGRNTLWFYVLHQVVYIPILLIVIYSLGFRIGF